MVDGIKVDLYGQFDDDTRHECTYPVKLASQYSFTEETVWAKSIVDPRGLQLLVEVLHGLIVIFSD